MSSQDKDIAITISFGGPHKYVKAVAGSFDESYFKDPRSGQFTFPDYNTHWKGMVRFKDVTKYKKYYAARFGKKEMANLNMDNFECDFIAPEFQVESFPNFIRRFPEASFNKGISDE